jgi:hypothetical protein
MKKPSFMLKGVGPLGLLGATFALGLLAGRFLKRSAPRERSAAFGGESRESAPSASGEGPTGYERYESAYGEQLYDEADEAILSDDAIEVDGDLYPDGEDFRRSEG